MSDTKKKIIIVPRGSQILVRVDEAESRESVYGIIVPDEVEQERKSQGVVESVGSEIGDVKKGDKVIYGTYAGETIKLMEKGKKVEFKLLADSDVIAFIQ